MDIDLDYRNIKFPVSKRDYSETEQTFCINLFRYE